MVPFVHLVGKRSATLPSLGRPSSRHRFTPTSHHVPFLLCPQYQLLPVAARERAWQLRAEKDKNGYSEKRSKGGRGRREGEEGGEGGGQQFCQL